MFRIHPYGEWNTKTNKCCYKHLLFAFALNSVAFFSIWKTHNSLASGCITTSQVAENQWSKIIKQKSLKLPNARQSPKASSNVFHPSASWRMFQQLLVKEKDSRRPLKTARNSSFSFAPPATDQENVSRISKLRRKDVNAVYVLRRMQKYVWNLLVRYILGVFLFWMFCWW